MVNTYVLDGDRLLDREQAHRYLAEALDFPAWYGENLDALYDLLTEKGPCTLVLAGADRLRQAGGYPARLLDTICQAAEADPAIRLVFPDREI